MKALVFAYSEIGVVGLETLLELGVEIVGVVTHTDNPWEERWFRSVGAVAREKGLPVIIFENPNTPDALAWGKALQPDIVFSFYYRQLLKKPWLELAPLGAYNLHGSLLPKFRGRACVNWAIIEGAAETGVTLHEMVEKADAGEILGQERVSIGENDTARDVFDKLVPAARRLLMRVVPQLRDRTETRTKQIDSDATYFGGRKPEDGRIEWAWPARRIHNLVRAVAHPYPGAFTFSGGRKLIIWKGRPLAEKAFAVPGQVLEPRADGVPVATGDGLYLVENAQWDGETPQPANQILAQQKIILAN
jgi:methionyl-tRNA formyltransferase